MNGVKRTLRIENVDGDPTDGRRLIFPSSTRSLTVQVVDAADAPAAFTWALESAPQHVFHLIAGDIIAEDDLELGGELVIRVVSAAGTRVESMWWHA